MMDNNPELDGNAIVYCEGAFNTPNGKTAHGLVRHTLRYRVLSVIDSRYAGQDAGEVIDGKPRNIPVHADVKQAIEQSHHEGFSPTHLVVGLAPDGGRLTPSARGDVRRAIQLGLNVDSGLHDFLSEDEEIIKLSKQFNVKIRDIRKPPHRNQLHFFSGKIEQVDSLKIAVLGTDSAVGKRTTAWKIVQAFVNLGYSAEMVGTGQTAWMQGAKYCLILDSLVNDFLSGEIEHAVWSAWSDSKPDVIVIEGQGSLMNPAYPGGYEILAAGRPDIVVLQHAPERKEYDGFPGYPLHPITKQIDAIQTVSDKPVVAITVNHENMESKNVPLACEKLKKETGLPSFDVLLGGAEKLVEVLLLYLKKGK
jgi:uncharacterized NAD-dependent epimerase/dehydratase family protein